MKGLMTAQDIVIEAALTYGVNVNLLANDAALGLRAKDPPRGFSVGPMGGAGLSFKKNTLVISYGASSEDILHELCHLVVGRPSTWLSEGFVLMPFEWCLAQHLAKQMRKSVARSFLKGVRNYQDYTSVGRLQLQLEDYGPRCRHSEWWKRGVERARKLKLLYSDDTPTFLCAQWKDSGVPTQARQWDPGYYERYS